MIKRIVNTVYNRKWMFKKLNSYLTAVKLAPSDHLHTHNIQYLIHDNDSRKKSKNSYQLKDYRTESGKYDVMVYTAYYGGGIKITLRDVKDKDSRKTVLELELEDSIKNYINEELQSFVARFFKKKIYTAKEFDLSYFTYSARVVGTYKEVTEAYIELCLIAERLMQKEEVA